MRLYVQITYYICDMKKDKGIFVKVDAPFLDHVQQYFKDKGGLSATIRRYLAKKTKYKEPA